MQGHVHLIAGTPESSRRKILSQSTEADEQPRSCFVLPEELDFDDYPSIKWAWANDEFEIQISTNPDIDEFFLFISNKIEFPLQIEATILLLEKNPNLSLGRIILFINAQFLDDKNIYSWLDGFAHFADLICLAGRTNTNAHLINECIDRYKSMKYPLDCLILSDRKSPPISRILNPSPRRISHIFDPPDILEPDDNAENDPFLEKTPTGERLKPIPLIFENQ